MMENNVVSFKDVAVKADFSGPLGLLLAENIVMHDTEGTLTHTTPAQDIDDDKEEEHG